jgi:hypothetical protein
MYNHDKALEAIQRFKFLPDYYEVKGYRMVL